MATPAQIDANRRNAQQSTGPKTDAGKAAASQNAHSHGLCSASAVAPGDDPAVFQAFATAIVAELDPVGMNQRLQAERIAFLTWKLQRIPAIEASMLDVTRLRCKTHALKNGHVRHQFPAADLIAADLETVMKLQTYEMRLSRALETARKELRRLKDEASRAQAQATAQQTSEPRKPTAPPSVVPPVTPGEHPNPQSDQQLEQNWLRSAGAAPPAAPPPARAVKEVAA
jgi:hypothetical protein